MRSSHITIIHCTLAITLWMSLTTQAIAQPPVRSRSVQAPEAVTEVEKTLVRYRIRHLEAIPVMQKLQQLGLFDPRKLPISVDEQRQEIMAYGSADEHAKFKNAIEMLDVERPEAQDSQATPRGEGIHVVPIGELPMEVQKTITSIHQRKLKFLSFHDGLMIAEGAEKDVDAIMELIERIKLAHHKIEDRERHVGEPEPGDSIGLRLLCLLENGNSELPPLEEPLASELAKLGFGPVAKATELRTTTTLNENASREEFSVGGQIGDGQLQAEFKMFDMDGPENLNLMAEVAMSRGYGDEKSAVFQSKTLVRLPLGQWAVVAAAPAPESKSGSDGISPSRLILLLRADPMPLIKTN